MASRTHQAQADPTYDHVVRLGDGKETIMPPTIPRPQADPTNDHVVRLGDGKETIMPLTRPWHEHHNTGGDMHLR